MAAFLVLSTVTAFAQPDAEKETPGVEAAIPDPVKALAEPTIIVFPAGIRMAVTAATDKAQDHVNQGMNHLHGGWEFEASRHFAAAMREDPDCLLAHWGMVMSLLSPSPETGAARNAATDRLLDLLDAGQGSELERGYAYGLVKYMEIGPAGAANAFRKVAEKFPNDLQGGVFAALFTRSGYDEFGSPTPDQEAAENSLLEMLKINPDSPLLINALLTIRAESPNLGNSLDLARKLCELSPDYPPYKHLVGHCEWRSGLHRQAAITFAAAATDFKTWMTANRADIADCPDFVKAECYRAVALSADGDDDTALKAAREIAAIPIPATRPASPGARMLLWDAKTLPARILLHRGPHGIANEALASLPPAKDLKETHKTSLAYWWIDGLRLSLDAQRLIDEKKFTEAQDVINALTHHGEAMSKTQTAASASGERSAWTRAFRALEVIASDIRGRMAMAGPKERIGTAYNWFASATDRQHPSPLMLPPMILTPMASRLGGYYLAMDQPKDAIESYERALVAFPNDIRSLIGLKKSFTKAGLTDKATETQNKIESLGAP